MTDLRRLLAANIKTYRLELGLTQSKLAEKAETATHYIAMIEGGRNFPSPEMIERIAFALNRDSTELFAITSIQQNWKEIILKEINELVNEKIHELSVISERPTADKLPGP